MSAVHAGAIFLFKVRLQNSSLQIPDECLREQLEEKLLLKVLQSCSFSSGLRELSNYMDGGGKDQT